MGIPKFFRWLTERYPMSLQSIGTRSPVEYDTLFLDMNSVIHNCAHPFSASELNVLSMEEISAKTFRYISLLVSTIQPRKMLYMAVDGVAPRAKMNQQRSRRFKAARDAEEAVRALREAGSAVPQGILDTNAISPGTEFMAELMTNLQNFILHKQATDPLWARIEVVFSGHSAPGEGEHKIMEYLRVMRSRPDYDPKLRHCMYGTDADLILLSLVSYEPFFSILREETLTTTAFKQDRKDIPQPFQLLHVPIIREYLTSDFQPFFPPGMFQIDRLVDDFVFMMCLVGNDFLPNLPNISIAEHGLELMFRIYQHHVKDLGGYIMDGSVPDLERLNKFFGWLSQADSEGAGETPNFSQFEELDKSEEKEKELDEVSKAFGFDDDLNGKHVVKLQGLDVVLAEDDDDDDEEIDKTAGAFALASLDDDDDGEKKEVKEGEIDFYHQPGAAMREPYYTSKMGREASLRNPEYHLKMCKSYLDGISWVLRYYHDGVPSWDWFYPYHYAPYLAELTLTVPKWTPPVFGPSVPCRPLEQLLGVLPPQSSALVPNTYRYLMLASQSPIISYYPKSFKTDLNGKKAKWEELALIPFIETSKLRSAMKEAEARFPLSDEELARDVLLDKVPCYSVSADGESTTHDVCLTDIMPGSFTIKSKIRYIQNDYHSPHPQNRTSELTNVVKFIPDPFVFPTLFCSQFHTIVKAVQVLVHSRKSFDASVVCVMDPIPPEAHEVLKQALLGRPVLIGWPFLFPAVVESLCTKEGFIGTSGVMQPFKDGGKWFQQELSSLSKDYLRSRAVALDNVTVLAEVRPISGMVTRLDGSTEKLYNKGSILVPVQTIVLEPPDIDWVFTNRPAPDVLCPRGSRAVAINKGSLMLVETTEDSKKDSKTVKVNVCDRYDNNVATKISKLVSSFSRRPSAPLQGFWIPFHDFAVRCGLSHNYSALLHIIGTGEFFPTHKRVGLGIIIPNNTPAGSEPVPPTIRYGWAKYTNAANIYEGITVSDACVDLVAEFKDKFPTVYKAFLEAPRNKCPDTKSLGKNDEVLRKVSEWVKTLDHASAPLVPAGSTFMPTSAVVECASIAEASHPPMQVVADTSSTVEIPLTHLILPHTIGVYPKTYIPVPGMAENNLLRQLVVGDRVVNLLDDGLIDFGAVGTVIAVKGVYCDVLFDRAQYGGTDLDSLCSDYHGSCRHRIDLVPFPSSKSAPKSK